MSKKLHISLIFSNLVVTKNIKFKPSYVQPLYKIRKNAWDMQAILWKYRQWIVNESGNVPHRGHVPKFSDMELVALSLTAEIEGIDSEKWLWLSLQSKSRIIDTCCLIDSYAIMLNSRCYFFSRWWRSSGNNVYLCLYVSPIERRNDFEAM